MIPEINIPMLSLLVNLYTAGLSFGLPSDCMIEDTSVTCINSLPHVLPDNVFKVTVHDFVEDRIDNDTFVDRSWGSVRYLDITARQKVELRLQNYNFLALINITTLGIHSPHMTLKGGRNILYGLAQLQSLNLSSCSSLTAEDVGTLLHGTHIRLKSLSLNQCSQFGSNQLMFDQSFLEILSEIEVEALSLSGTDLIIKGPLNVFNLSFAIAYLDISNTTVLPINFHRRDRLQLMTIVLLNLRTINISQIQERFLDLDYGFLSNVRTNPRCNEAMDDKIGSIFYMVEHLVMNSFFSRNLSFNNSMVNISACAMRLHTLYIGSNNIEYMNVTMFWPSEIQLFKVDLSSNGMRYMSPYSLATLTSLKELNLASNKLNYMESYTEFEYLFQTFEKLCRLNLSSNELTYIPRGIFSKNINLTVLDMSNNNLGSINFEVQHLTNLRILNMQKNRIHFIDGEVINKLNSLILTELNGLQIDLSENPFECSCQTIPFIRWIHSVLNTKQSSRYTYGCTIEGTHIPIDQNAIDRSYFLCIRSKVIIGSVLAGATSLSTMLIIIIWYAKRRQAHRLKRIKGHFLEDFKNRLLPQKFLCFLSVASADEGDDTTELYMRLGQMLQEITTLDKELVCMGDQLLNPGFPIVAEILRCISESSVAVFIVTRTFSTSRWCQMELREAYELNKPIILIFKENIEIDLMPPLMLHIFNNFTRAKLVVTEDGRHELIPSYGIVCGSIVDLAAASYEGSCVFNKGTNAFSRRHGDGFNQE